MPYRKPPRNYQWLLAKIGQKADQTQRTLAMLPRMEDLPNDQWRILDERTWRTGRLGPRSDEGNRAAALGLVTGIRSFENAARSRWLWAEVLPFASLSDAQTALPDLPNRMARNPRAEFRSLGESPVDPPAIVGASESIAIAHEASDRAGNNHVGQMLLARVDSMIAIVAASGYVDWSWDEVEVVANSFAQRIKAGVQAT